MREGKSAVDFADSLSSMKYLNSFVGWCEESIGLKIINSKHYLYKTKRNRLVSYYVPSYVGV